MAIFVPNLNDAVTPDRRGQHQETKQTESKEGVDLKIYDKETHQDDEYEKFK